MSDNLIELVRQYEVLYNPKCKEYKDQLVRTAAWEEIAEKLGEPVEKCRENWAKMRNAYASALKRRRKNKKRGKDTVNEIPWKYEDQMNFLRPHMETRSSKSNLSSPLEVIISDNSSGCPFTIDDTQRSAGMQHPPKLSSLSGEESQRIALHRKKNSELSVSYNSMEIQNDVKRQTQNSIQDLDETDLFFMSMSKAVKALPKLDQTRIKLNLHTAVSEAEIRNIQ